MPAFPLDMKAEMQVREEKLKEKNANYLQSHPEVEMMLQDFISAALVEQPVDVFDFARKFFSTGPSAPTPLASGDDGGETGEVAPAGSDQGEQINDVDQDDLDGAPSPARLEPARPPPRASLQRRSLVRSVAHAAPRREPHSLALTPAPVCGR